MCDRLSPIPFDSEGMSMRIRPFVDADLPALIDLTIETFRPLFEGQTRPAYGEELFELHHGQWEQDYRDELPGLHDPAARRWIAVAEIDGDTGREIAREVGRDVGREIGRDVGRDAGGEVGRDAGGEVGRDAGVEVGREVGRDTGGEVGRDVGREIGRDVGRDAGGEVGRDVGRDAGGEVGRDAGRDAGGEVGRDTGRDIAGFVAWESAGDRRDHGRISLLAVAEPYRRGHVGSRLCRHALDAMKAAGVEVVELGTGGEDAFHAAARALYESLGFIKVPIAGYIMKL
jgi:ribosomal protein S18 acetylase RimI-like enzyme